MPKFTLADFRKDLSPKYKLAPQLDKAIKSFDEEWTFTYQTKEPDLYWHPSSHCTPLPSVLYDHAQDRLNDEDDEEFQQGMRKYSQVGHFWHQFLQHIMVRYDMVVPNAIERTAAKVWEDDRTYRVEAPNVIGKPFHVCRGSADVAPWAFRGHDYIVDFKTMASRSFQRPTLPEAFAAKYECQMNIYMDFFDYDRALILAINKDTPHDFKEFEFRRNQPLIDTIYEKWKFVAHCIEDNERPDADDDLGFDLPLEWA